MTDSDLGFAKISLAAGRKHGAKRPPFVIVIVPEGLTIPDLNPHTLVMM